MSGVARATMSYQPSPSLAAPQHSTPVLDVGQPGATILLRLSLSPRRPSPSPFGLSRLRAARARLRAASARNWCRDRLTHQIVVQGAGDPDLDDLTNRARPVHEHHAVHLGRIAAAPPDPDCPTVELALALNQHLLDRTDQGLIRPVRGGLRRRHQLVAAAYLDALRDPVIVLERGRALLIRVEEDADPPEPERLDRADRVLVLGLGLAREAGDEGRAHRHIGHNGANPADQILDRLMRPAHPSQRL